MLSVYLVLYRYCKSIKTLNPQRNAKKTKTKSHQDLCQVVMSRLDSQVRHVRTSSFILKQSKCAFGHKTLSRSASTAAVFRSEMSLGLTKYSCVSSAWHWYKSQPKWQIRWSSGPSWMPISARKKQQLCEASVGDGGIYWAWLTWDLARQFSVFVDKMN